MPLPSGAGRTVINVEFGGLDRGGLTWVKDRAQREFHNVYLRTSPEKVLGGVLRCEIARAVLATRFAYPHRLPAWIEVGFTGRYAEPARIAAQRQIVRWYLETDNMPPIERVLTARDISPEDETTAAIATSLTDYLIALAGKQRFLEFAQATGQVGLESALWSHYHLESVRQLETGW